MISKISNGNFNYFFEIAKGYERRIFKWKNSVTVEVFLLMKEWNDTQRKSGLSQKCKIKAKFENLTRLKIRYMYVTNLNFNLMLSELFILKGLPCGYGPVGFKQILLSTKDV